MSRARVRPEFWTPLICDQEPFFAALGDQLVDAESECSGQTFGDYAILRVRAEKRRFWSPTLHLQYVAADAASPEPRLHGRFSPSSPVWTMFVAVYISLAVLACIGLSWGLAQWTLEETPWALALFPLAIALAGFTYGAAFIGQGLGAEEMYQLRSFVDHTIETCTEAHQCNAQ